MSWFCGAPSLLGWVSRRDLCLSAWDKAWPLGNNGLELAQGKPWYNTVSTDHKCTTQDRTLSALHPLHPPISPVGWIPSPSSLCKVSEALEAGTVAA